MDSSPDGRRFPAGRRDEVSKGDGGWRWTFQAGPGARHGAACCSSSPQPRPALSQSRPTATSSYTAVPRPSLGRAVRQHLGYVQTVHHIDTPDDRSNRRAECQGEAGNLCPECWACRRRVPGAKGGQGAISLGTRARGLGRAERRRGAMRGPWNGGAEPSASAVWTLRLQRRRAPTGVRSAWGEGVVGVPWTGGTAQLKAATREGEGAPKGRNTGGTVAGTDRGDGKLIGEGGREQRRPREMHGWPSCSGRRERGKQRGGNFAMTGDGRRNP